MRGDLCAPNSNSYGGSINAVAVRGGVVDNVGSVTLSMVEAMRLRAEGARDRAERMAAELRYVYAHVPVVSCAFQS